DNAQCAEILDNWPKFKQAVRNLKVHINKEEHSPVVFTHNELLTVSILWSECTGGL
ncbi:hypothetical protein LPJ59_006532, partial [Coemansia sp. RSA 2399]